MTTEIKIDNIEIIRDSWRAKFNLEIQKGEIVTIIGPSGGGKTTLLETISGFNTPEKGAIYLNNKNSMVNITNTHPAHRNMGVMFQKSSFFPHLTVSQNLLLALHDSKISYSQKLKLISESLNEVQLSENYLRRYPSEVSGGELSRLNLARTLLRPFSILLLDEPFAALDEKLRLEMNSLIQKIHIKRNLTTISVTHAQEEAFIFSDRIIVVQNGEITFNGSPAELMTKPPSAELSLFLKTGIRFLHNTKVFYLKPSNLTLCPNKAKDFKKCVTINIGNNKEDYRSFFNGLQMSIFSVKHSRIFNVNAGDFNGNIYFDEDNAEVIESLE